MTERRALVGRPEVANYLGIPPATLAQWAHRGIGPKYVRVGRHAKYHWSDVDAWIESQSQGGGTAA